MVDITIDGKVASTPHDRQKRIAALIWGPSGCGKTTLASTAPGKKLWLLFDIDGDSSLEDREDVHVLDYSRDNPNIVMRFKSDNPIGLTKILQDENCPFDTIVFDSVTSFSDLALRYGITEVKGATIEAPSLAGYGRRNSYTMQAIFQLIRLTSKFNKHIIIIAHEDVIKKDEATGTLFQTIMAGGKLPTDLPIQLSEVWYLQDTGKEHVVVLRSTRMKKPMKTRMFDVSDKGEFVWKYNPVTRKGEGIADWYNRWIENNGRKIQVP